MPERSAIFIDEAYLSQVIREQYRGVRIDYELLARALSQGTDLLRSYVYSSLPYQSEAPTPEEKSLFAGRRQFFSRLRLLPRYTVQLGRTERRVNANGIPYYEQKRVDILLAVELVKLSANRHIQQAILIAGDSDFIPAITAAKSEGVVVKLYHGRTPHRELLEEVDEHYRFDQALIDSIKFEKRDSGV